MSFCSSEASDDNLVFTVFGGVRTNLEDKFDAVESVSQLIVEYLAEKYWKNRLHFPNSFINTSSFRKAIKLVRRQLKHSILPFFGCNLRLYK